MSKMQELYEKVAADSALQAKFVEIMKDAEAAGEESTNEKLTAFVKEAGYEISLTEITAFFKEMAELKEGELSEVELDMVAGGKFNPAKVYVTYFEVQMGFTASLMTEVLAGGCKDDRFNS